MTADKIDERFVKYEATFIDERSRKRMRERNSNLRTRKFGLMPKSGDLMEVSRHCFGGSGSYFVPVRMGFSNYYDEKVASFDLDLMDSWRQSEIPAIMSLRQYDDFREFSRTEEEIERLRAQNVFGRYEVVLVKNGSTRVHEETREIPCSDSDPVKYLFNFIPGRLLVQGIVDMGRSFPPLIEIPARSLIVQAVLHPLFGLPKVLLQRK